jgi:tetratricopeptide (TPR) repeat protein
VGLLEDALERLPTEQLATRALVLARLADVLLYAHDWDRTGALSAAAVATARESGEPVALMRAIESRLLALLRPATYPERRALADELEELAESSGLPERILSACTWQLTFALERGDRGAIDRHHARFLGIAEEQRQHDMLWGARLQSSMLALLEGRFDDADRLAHEALAVAGDAVPLSTQMFGVQMLGVRAGQGRMAELEPGMRAMVAAFPEVAAWRLTWAAVMTAVGHVEEGRAELERIAGDDFLIAPDDYEWLPGIAMVAEAFARLGDRERCAVLYERLLPFEDTHIVVSLGVAYAGVVGRQLGLLAAVLGDRVAAERHFERAIAALDALGAAAYAEGARSELAALRGGAVPFQREGDVWAIGSVRVRDAKGLGYIAELIVRPGVDVAAVDLAGAVRTGDAGPALDADAKRAYRARVDDLRATIDEADRWNDGERAAAARTELDALTAELAGAVGLGGRDRPTASGAERARVSVTKAIRTAIKRIAEHDSALAQHLDQAIATGAVCRYDPPARDPIAWEFSSTVDR